MEYYFIEIENFIMKKQILEYPELIQDKIIYLLQDGKRLRPILCIIFSGLDNTLDTLKKKSNDNLKKNISDNEKTKIIYNVASFIEQIHCLSLVLDDLPEMDNDSMRRGKQSFHTKFNINYTNFFLYYMFNRLSLSLNSILDTYIDINLNININPKNNNILNNNLNFAKKIKKLLSNNLNILIDGQYNDLTMQDSSSSSSFLEKQDSSFLEKQDSSFLEKIRAKNNEEQYSSYEGVISRERLLQSSEIKIIFNLLEKKILESNDLLIQIINNIELNMKKTSSLFNLSICSGFVMQLWINNYDLEKFNDIYEKISIWANILGYMFQVSDDILDIDDDKAKGNPNICQIIGKDITHILLKNGCDWLLENIKLITIECNMNIIMNININNNNNDKNNDKIFFNLDAIKDIIDKILKRIEKN